MYSRLISVDRCADDERQADEDVGGHAAHRGEALDLAAELLPLAHGVGDHVEEPGERAADLALDGDGGHDELEVLRADAHGHLGQRVVHRAAEAGLGEDALELSMGGVDALVDDALHALAEAVPGLEARLPSSRGCPAAAPRRRSGASWPCAARRGRGRTTPPTTASAIAQTRAARGAPRRSPPTRPAASMM